MKAKGQVNLDTGVITLHYAKNEPEARKTLFAQIKAQELQAFVVSPALIECFYQLAKFPRGIEFTERNIAELHQNCAISIVPLDLSSIITAGVLKTQFQTVLSMEDPK